MLAQPSSGCSDVLKAALPRAENEQEAHNRSPAAWKGRFQGGRQSDSERPDTRHGARVERGTHSGGTDVGKARGVVCDPSALCPGTSFSTERLPQPVGRGGRPGATRG